MRGPPRLARRWLSRTLPSGERDDVLANLDDLYHRRRQRAGTTAARLWYWRQAIGFGPRVRIARWRDGHHRVGMGPTWTALGRDVRFGVRQLARAPVFSLAAGLTLALGVGATALIYAVVYAAVIRPLPYPDADRLVWVWASGEVSLTYRQFRALQEAARPAAALTAYAGRQYAVVGDGQADEVAGLAVSPGHFEVFGLPPHRGRAFRSGDAGAGAERVAVISYELWQSRFGGDPAILGRRVDLYLSAAIPMIPGAFSGAPHTVVGIAPPGYRPFGFGADVFTPLRPNPANSGFADIGELRVVARLAPGVTPTGFQQDLVSLAARVPEMAGLRNEIGDDPVVTLHEALVGDVRPAMFATLAAVGLVLLVAGVNVANLLLVRTRDRQPELAVRRALGAGRGAVARQLLTECALLSFGATTLGVAAAAGTLPVAVRFLPAGLIPPDAGAGAGAGAMVLASGPLVVALAVMVGVTALCGALPAWEGGRGGESLGTSRRGVTGRRRHGVNRALAIAEIAVAVVLVYAAGLLSASFVNVTRVEAGFSPEDVTTIRLAPSEARYRDVDARRELYERFLGRVRAWPEVEAAGAIHFLPVADGGPSIFFRTDPGSDERLSAGYRVVTPGYLEALRIPVLRGRGLTDQDGPGALPAGLVNQALAERLWPGENPLGRVLYRTNGQTFLTVVGVVANVRQHGPAVRPQPELYLPLAQSGWASAMTVTVRAGGPAPQLGPALAELAGELDPHLPVTRVASMESILAEAVAEPRFYGILFGLFGALALILATVGVYGVVAYVVGARRAEIGIRLALGATRRRIAFREAVRSGVMAGIGLGAGVIAAIGGGRLLGGFLVGVDPMSPPLLGATVAIIGAVVAAAAGLPVRRVSRTDPMLILRAD